LLTRKRRMSKRKRSKGVGVRLRVTTKTEAQSKRRHMISMAQDYWMRKGTAWSRSAKMKIKMISTSSRKCASCRTLTMWPSTPLRHQYRSKRQPQHLHLASKPKPYPPRPPPTSLPFRISNHVSLNSFLQTLHPSPSQPAPFPLPS